MEIEYQQGFDDIFQISIEAVLCLELLESMILFSCNPVKNFHEFQNKKVYLFFVGRETNS